MRSGIKYLTNQYQITLKVCILIQTFFFIHGSANAQFSFNGYTKDSVSGEKVPFVHIIVNNGETEAISDLNGQFEIHHKNPIYTISFNKKLYKPYKLKYNLDSTLNQEISLVKNNEFVFEETSHKDAERIIEQVLAKSKINTPGKKENYEFNSYNKFTVTLDNSKFTTNFVNFIISVLTPKDISFEGDQHVFIMESVNHKKHENQIRQKETIIASKVSGIENASLLSAAFEMQPFSVYDPFISLAGKEYLNPVHRIGRDQYIFNLIDTIYLPDERLFIIQFNPKKNNHFDDMKGFYYINETNYAIHHLELEPADHKKVKMKIYMSQQKLPGNKWFPKENETLVSLGNLGTRKMTLTARAKTYYEDIELGKDYHNKWFDEVILDYTPGDSTKLSDSILAAERLEPLTVQDINTYEYFDSLGSIKSFDRLENFAEKIYLGMIPFKKINFELDKFINYNDFEKLRVGLGFRTNKSFSKKLLIGSYFGYGTNDDQIKYGGRIQYKIWDKADLKIKYSYKNDLLESGIHQFAFDKPQFSSEPLRKYRSGIFDFTSAHQVGLSAELIRYFKASVSLKNEFKTLQYTYDYLPLNGANTFNFTSLDIGFRFSFGEQFIQTLDRKISLGTKYPEIWVNYSRNIEGLLGSQFNFEQIIAKIEESIRLPGIGKLKIQLEGGIVQGDAPYSELFVGEGAHKNFSVIVHNAFETMFYNEFLSDRYAALHFSHNFGKYKYKNKRFEPSIEMLHNFGFGSLANPSIHQGIQYKTMEKGYFESGIFADNFFIIYLPGLKTGLGAGLFMRYGPYALSKPIHNFLAKASVNFKL